MKHKIFAYSFAPVLGLSMFGANIASAHGLFGSFSNLTPDQIASQQQSMFQNEAAILGINVDDVKSACADGKTIEQLMTEKGITQDQVKARMKDNQIAQLKKQLQALVDKGVITQAQSDKRLQAMQAQIQNGTIRKSHMGMMGSWRRGFRF